MKHIEKDELYRHLSAFLRAKGIDLKEGSYTNFIHNGCKVLAEAVNLSQQGLERAKNGLNEKLGQVRQAIHQKTAPKPPPSQPAQPAPPAGPAPPKARKKKRSKGKGKARGARGRGARVA